MSDRYFVSYEVDDVRSVHHWCVFDRQRSNHDYWDSVCMSFEEADAQKVCDDLNLVEKACHLNWLISQLPAKQQVEIKETQHD